MTKLKFILSDGTVTAHVHSTYAETRVDWEAQVVGIQTVIDESRVYPADLSSPFFTEEPNVRHP